MRAMGVVLIDVVGKNGVELVAGEDQDPVEALPTDGADETFGERIGPRGTDRCANDPDLLGAEDLVKAGRDLVSRSRTRKWTACVRSANTMLRLRACWMTHGPVGFAVALVT